MKDHIKNVIWWAGGIIIAIVFTMLFLPRKKEIKDTHYEIGPGEVFATSSTISRTSFIYRQGNELRKIDLCTNDDQEITSEFKFKKIVLHSVEWDHGSCDVIDKVELP